VVAIVGENGAGKTTLVKLLAKMYAAVLWFNPRGRQPLARVRAGEWRAASGRAFQDFFRFEFRLGHSVGLGDLPDWTTNPLCSRLWIAPARVTLSRV